MDENDRQERKSFLSQMEAYLGRNEVREVLDLAQARLKRTPGDLDARIMICRVWLLQGRLDEARDMLNEMEETIASFSHVYACIGDIYMKRGMREAAGSSIPVRPWPGICRRGSKASKNFTKRMRKGKRKGPPKFPPTSRR
jgi:hypothetical protein